MFAIELMIILRDVHFLVLLPQGFVLRPIDQAVAIKALYLLKIFLPAGVFANIMSIANI